MRELVTRIPWLRHGGQPDLNGGRDLFHNFPHNYVLDGTLVCRRTLADVVLVLAEPLVFPYLPVIELAS